MSSNQVPEQARPDVRIIRSAERSTWRDSALLSRQSFPATGNFDMEGNAFGLLMVHNDDIVAPGEGFDMHEHRNVELVTWVMEGALRHRDDGGSITGAAGAEATLEPGMAQHISAGHGIRHSELNASGYLAGKKLRVIQAWLPPTTADTEPRHSETDLTEALSDGLLHPVASGTPDRAPLTIGTEGATLWAGRNSLDHDRGSRGRRRRPADRFRGRPVAHRDHGHRGPHLGHGPRHRLRPRASASTSTYHGGHD